MITVFPLPLLAALTDQASSWQSVPAGWTEIPLPPHPGAFAAQRRHHIHEGVDLYCPEQTPVRAMEDAQVIYVGPFTGAAAASPWWFDTSAVLLRGATGFLLYGEVSPVPDVRVGQAVQAGYVLGHVTPVLKTDKGRPRCMLHLEHYAASSNRQEPFPGNSLEALPDWVLDPTPLLRPFALARPYKSEPA